MTEHEHDGLTMDCASCQIIRSRRAVLLTRALHAPEGLTPYDFTRGVHCGRRELAGPGVGSSVRPQKRSAMRSETTNEGNDECRSTLTPRV